MLILLTMSKVMIGVIPPVVLFLYFNFFLVFQLNSSHSVNKCLVKILDVTILHVAFAQQYSLVS